AGEVRQILKKPARTKHGWVVGEINASESLEATRYSPETRRIELARAKLGETVHLRDLFGRVAPVDLAALQPSGPVPVLTASNISRDGGLRLNGLAAAAAVSEEQRLQLGDLCLRRALGSRERRLAVYEVGGVAASAAIDYSVIAVRPLPNVTEPLRVFV